jgi:hypothetical protein
MGCVARMRRNMQRKSWKDDTTWETYIKIDLKETGYKNMNWIRRKCTIL